MSWEMILTFETSVDCASEICILFNAFIKQFDQFETVSFGFFCKIQNEDKTIECIVVFTLSSCSSSQFCTCFMCNATPSGQTWFALIEEMCALETSVCHKFGPLVSKMCFNYSWETSSGTRSRSLRSPKWTDIIICLWVRNKRSFCRNHRDVFWEAPGEFLQSKINCRKERELPTAFQIIKSAQLSVSPFEMDYFALTFPAKLWQVRALCPCLCLPSLYNSDGE